MTVLNPPDVSGRVCLLPRRLLDSVDGCDADRRERLTFLDGFREGLRSFVFPSGTVQRDELLQGFWSPLKENGPFCEFQGPIVRIPR